MATKPGQAGAGTSEAGGRMYYEDPKNTFNFVSGLIIGALVGAGIALLAAPTSGKRTRRKMLRRVMNARQVAGDRMEDWTDDLRSAVRSGRRRLRT
jgi:hypothetical protein